MEPRGSRFLLLGVVAQVTLIAPASAAAVDFCVKEKGADGKFFGTVPAKTVLAGECPAAKSKSKRVD